MSHVDAAQAEAENAPPPTEEDFLAADREAEARALQAPRLGRFPNRAEKLFILGFIVSRLSGFEASIFNRLFGYPPEFHHEVVLCAFWMAALYLLHVLLPDDRD